MNQHILSPRENWSLMLDSFRQRLSCEHQRNLLRECVNNQFMRAQHVSMETPPKLAHTNCEWQGANVLLTSLSECLLPFLNRRHIQFRAESFGVDTNIGFNDQLFLSAWCLILDVATIVTANSTVELSLGCLGERIELELGSDCEKLENYSPLPSPAFRFCNQLLTISEATDLKCPLGGGAVQLNVASASAISSMPNFLEEHDSKRNTNRKAA